MLYLAECRKEGKKADGRLRSVRGSLAARVVWRAVDINEISFILLNARKKEYGHLSSFRVC